MLNQLRTRFARAGVQNAMFNAQFLGSKSLMYNPHRGIKLHEYQAGKLLDSYRVSIPHGEVAWTPEEAEKIASKFENGCVIKS